MVLAAKRRSEAVLSFAHARELDARYGTPLLAVAPSGIQDAYRTMRDRLAGVELFYAAKANSDPLVLEALQVVGSAIDVCSVNEMQAALAAGFAIERMIHTHPCKSEANLRECYERGIRRFVYDNVNELDKFVRHAAGAELMLRVGVSGPSSALNLSRKFGARQDEAIELLLAAQRKGLRANGISMHIGSQCMDPSDYDIAFAKIRAIYDQAIRHGIDLQMIDIGGGFPAPYRGQSLIALADYCDIVYASLRKHLGDLNVQLIAEPGRALCAESVTLVTKVIGKNVREGITWYFLDDGIYGAFSAKRPGHTDFQLLAENPCGLQASACVVAGPTCDGGDVLYYDHPLPDLQLGDLVLVPTMGAYTSASACCFNGLAVPRLVTVE